MKLLIKDVFGTSEQTVIDFSADLFSFKKSLLKNFAVNGKIVGKGMYL